MVRNGRGRRCDLTAGTCKCFHSIKIEGNVLFDDCDDSYVTVNKYQNSLNCIHISGKFYCTKLHIHEADLKKM